MMYTDDVTNNVDDGSTTTIRDNVRRNYAIVDDEKPGWGATAHADAGGTGGVGAWEGGNIWGWR